MLQLSFQRMVEMYSFTPLKLCMTMSCTANEMRAELLCENFKNPLKAVYLPSFIATDSNQNVSGVVEENVNVFETLLSTYSLYVSLVNILLFVGKLYLVYITV